MTSLKRQLRIGMLAAVAGAAAVLFYWGNLGVDSLLRDYVVTRLQHDADSVAAALTRTPQGAWRIDETRLGPIYERVYSGHYYRVIGDDTDIRSRSMWDLSIDLRTVPAGTGMQDVGDGPGQQHLLTWTQGIRKSGDALTLWLAEDVSNLDTARRRYSLMALAALAIIIIVLAGSQQWIIRRGFSRLDVVRSAIRDLKSGRIESLTTDVPNEIEPLVREINRLLVRLEGKVARSRNAMGNLAHELKRPVHRLRRLAGSLEGEMGRDVEAAVDEVEYLVSRELKRARIVGVATPGRQTRLDEDLPALVEALERMYPGRLINTRHDAGLVLPQDRDDMLELLGNLLDNALKHGAGDVTLRISGQPTGWLIEVEDQGRGVPDHESRRVLERGARLDETRSGSGLGLAICADIVREYGGHIELSNLEPGGLRVSVTLDRQAE